MSTEMKEPEYYCSLKDACFISGLSEKVLKSAIDRGYLDDWRIGRSGRCQIELCSLIGLCADLREGCIPFLHATPLPEKVVLTRLYALQFGIYD